MDKHKYLQSNILEEYVMGHLSDDVMEKITAEIAKFPELKAEVERIEETLLAYAAIYSPPISPELKQKILDIPNKQIPEAPNEKPILSSLGLSTKKQKSGISKLKSILFSSRFLIFFIGMLIIGMVSYFIINNEIANKTIPAALNDVPVAPTNKSLDEDDKIIVQTESNIIPKKEVVPVEDNSDKENEESNNVEIDTTPQIPLEPIDTPIKPRIKPPVNPPSPPKLPFIPDSPKSIPLRQLGPFQRTQASLYIEMKSETSYYLELNGTSLPKLSSDAVYQIWGLKSKNSEILIPTWNKFIRLEQSERIQWLTKNFTPIQIGKYNRDLKNKAFNFYRASFPEIIVITVDYTGGSNTLNYEKIIYGGIVKKD